MKIGVDSCVVVSGIHTSHPLHAVAAEWLIRNISANELIITHHSILETYAVLTRLPGILRITGPEAKQLLEATIRPNMKVAGFTASSIWDCIVSLVDHSAVAGQSYDAFTAEVLTSAGVEAIATFNTTHFTNLASHLSIIDPSRPSAADG